MSDTDSATDHRLQEHTRVYSRPDHRCHPSEPPLPNIWQPLLYPDGTRTIFQNTHGSIRTTQAKRHAIHDTRHADSCSLPLPGRLVSRIHSRGLYRAKTTKNVEHHTPRHNAHLAILFELFWLPTRAAYSYSKRVLACPPFSVGPPRQMPLAAGSPCLRPKGPKKTNLVTRNPLSALVP